MNDRDITARTPAMRISKASLDFPSTRRNRHRFGSLRQLDERLDYLYRGRAARADFGEIDPTAGIVRGIRARASRSVCWTLHVLDHLRCTVRRPEDGRIRQIGHLEDCASSIVFPKLRILGNRRCEQVGLAEGRYQRRLGESTRRLKLGILLSVKTDEPRHVRAAVQQRTLDAERGLCRPDGVGKLQQRDPRHHRPIRSYAITYE